MSRLFDSYHSARAHLNDDLVTPSVRIPRRSVLMLTPSGVAFASVPVQSNAYKIERERRQRTRRNVQRWVARQRARGLM